MNTKTPFLVQRDGVLWFSGLMNPMFRIYTITKTRKIERRKKTGTRALTLGTLVLTLAHPSEIR